MPTRGIYVALWVALLATFALPSTAFDLVMTPRCGAVGEDRPLVPDQENPGQLIPAKGDFYNRTKCYCRRSEGTPDDTIWDGSYFHISYFSQSQARRFDIEWTCKASSSDRNAEWGDTDCAAKQNMEYFWRPGEFRYTGCADCGDPNSVKWCYSAQHQSGNRDQSILWIKNNPRAMYLNEFAKDVTPYWNEVHDTCDRLCKEKVDPNVGCLYWAYNERYPVTPNTLNYIDDAFVLRLPTPQ